MRFLCDVPRDIGNDFNLLKRHLERRFGKRDPPATVRRKLSDFRQKPKETNEEFAEELNRLVIRAYLDVGLDVMEQLSAEHFLKGYKNNRIAYEVVTKSPSDTCSE